MAPPKHFPGLRCLSQHQTWHHSQQCLGDSGCVFLQCRSSVLLAGQDDAVWEGSKKQSLFVIQILYKPCCSWRSVVPFILWSGYFSVSSHRAVRVSASTGHTGMTRTGLEVSVTQHRAMAAGRKHKVPTSADQIHNSSLLLAFLSSAG